MTFSKTTTKEILVSLAIDRSKGVIYAGGAAGKIFSSKNNGDIKLVKTL
jgi:hypothetical protein